MNRNEVKALLAMIDVTYPNWHVKDKRLAVDVWSSALQEYTFEQVKTGFTVYASTEKTGFAPSPGQLIDAIRSSETDPDEETNAAEAWEQVYKVICGTAWYAMDEAFYTLPKASQRALGSASALKEIGQMTTDAVLSVEKSHFIKEYREQVKRDKEYQALPAKVRERIERKKHDDDVLEDIKAGRSLKKLEEES